MRARPDSARIRFDFMVRKERACEMKAKHTRKRQRVYTPLQLSKKVDTIMATLADVQSDLTQIQADIDILKSKPATGVLTQAELDALKVSTGKALADLNALVTPPTV